MKSVAKKLLPAVFHASAASIYHKYFCDFSERTYAQEGEDMILRELFHVRRNGFYVDIGAHHPKRLSNTYYFYKLGWHGINVDAMPGSMQLFNRLRPRDTNLEIAVSDKIETLTYYVFNEPALNGFSKELADKRDGISNFRIIGTSEIRTSTLSDILDEHLEEGQSIDFLSVDVEGLDSRVLSGNNWNKYRPAVVLFEDLGSTLLSEYRSPSKRLLEKNGYALYAKTGRTVFFIRKDFYDETINT